MLIELSSSQNKDENQREEKLMGMLRIMIFLFLSAQGYHGTNIFHSITEFLPPCWIILIQKIYKHTLIVFHFKMKVSGDTSIFLFPSSRKLPKKLSVHFLYSLTYIHPFAFLLAHRSNLAEIALVKVSSDHIRRTFSVFSFYETASFPISNSGYFFSSVYCPFLLISFCLLSLHYLNWNIDIPQGFALVSLHLSSYNSF